ncbi:PIN domain-containing protein [Methylobacterium oryzihabitans]|uniref:PIN domain-containing protein n=1 Tax=Methylobacterium oryzihabitans TaxID=2499852 RepID=A0A437PE45_9HYPH|nr:PIN domain-containing protein [Methylobacterium oryzihabitans]RVU20545.1 hypothetical protein EOE48_04125 [Methylobacterium oryzihabitans]
MTIPILLDTQLMVLLAVGATSLSIIPKHKNLTEFTVDDFELLLHLLGRDPELILLPNTVSEAANLLRQHRDPERSRIMATLETIVGSNVERYVPSSEVVLRPDFRRLGLTDTAILEACKLPAYQILTADLDLFVAASISGLQAVSFNHQREDYGLI